jgi:hypothetical protein
VCVCKRGKIYCASLSASSLYESYISNEAQDFSYGGVMVVAWFHEVMAQAVALQSLRMCVVGSSSPRHLSQMGLSVNPNLKRCSVSTTTYCSWFQFNFSSSEGPCRSAFAYFRLLMVSQFSCSPDLDHFFFATPIKMLQAGSGPTNGRSDRSLAN